MNSANFHFINSIHSTTLGYVCCFFMVISNTLPINSSLWSYRPFDPDPKFFVDWSKLKPKELRNQISVESCENYSQQDVIYNIENPEPGITMLENVH